MSINVDVSEVRAYGRDLSASAPAVVARARRVLRKVAADIEGDAKILAPYDTGALRSSISTTVAGDTAVVGPTVEYGIYQEFGTSEQSGKPYLAPAFDRRRPGLERALAAVLVDVAGGRG